MEGSEGLYWEFEGKKSWCQMKSLKHNGGSDVRNRRGLVDKWTHKSKRRQLETTPSMIRIARNSTERSPLSAYPPQTTQLTLLDTRIVSYGDVMA